MDEQVADSHIRSFDEIEYRLGEQREQLLQAFDKRGRTEIDTSTLRRDSGVPTGSVRHHLEKLVEWGLVIEEDSRRYISSGGSHARVWSLTERGEEFVDECIDQHIPEADLEALQQRVVKLESEIEEMREQHEKDLEDLNSRMKQAILSLKEQL